MLLTAAVCCYWHWAQPCAVSWRAHICCTQLCQCTSFQAASWSQWKEVGYGHHPSAGSSWAEFSSSVHSSVLLLAVSLMLGLKLSKVVVSDADSHIFWEGGPNLPLHWKSARERCSVSLTIWPGMSAITISLLNALLSVFTARVNWSYLVTPDLTILANGFHLGLCEQWN